MLDAYKELAPILYGEHAIKYLYIECDGGEMCFRMHWHDRVELLYVVSGKLKLHLDDRQTEVPAGHVAVIGPRMLHGGFTGENGVKFHTIMFDLENFYNQTQASDKYLTGFFRNEVCFQPVTSDIHVIEPLHQLVKLLTSEEMQNPLPAVGLVYSIIGNLYQFCTESIRPVHKTNKNFRTVLDYINDHFTEDISTQTLSSRFGYNETYFCRRFKTVTGITLMRYLQILRMELAQKLLINTETGITEIALECGFTDISYFSNCFKKHIGVMPSHFRNTYKSQGGKTVPLS